MTRSVLLLATLAAALALSEAAEAWSWPDGQQRKGSSASSAAPASASRDTPASAATAGRSEGRRFFGGNRPRYEIVDPDSDDFTLPHPEDLAPGRPQSRPPFSPQRPFSSQRPLPGEPDYPLGSPNPAYRPPRPLGQGFGQGPLGGNRPLGGVDRYGDGGDPTTVSKCKCVHAFNCEGNALQFGSCDAGKRYCCSKEPRGLGAPRPGGYGATPGGPLGGPGGPGGPSGFYGGRPAILTGPGGPGSPVKGDYDRYPSGGFGGGLGGGNFPGSSAGLLVGPRPTYYRPDPAAGFASSPYRDYDSYNRGYGLNRS